MKRDQGVQRDNGFTECCVAEQPVSLSGTIAEGKRANMVIDNSRFYSNQYFKYKDGFVLLIISI